MKWWQYILLYAAIGLVAYGIVFFGPNLMEESKQCLHHPAANVRIVDNETIVTYLEGNEQGFIDGYKISIDGIDFEYEKGDWSYMHQERFSWVAEKCSVYAYDVAIHQWREIGVL